MNETSRCCGPGAGCWPGTTGKPGGDCPAASASAPLSAGPRSDSILAGCGRAAFPGHENCRGTRVASKPAAGRGGWLFKEEPGHYSYADLARDGTAVWEGVSNSLALQHLRKVRKGDRVLYYHTGKEKAAEGECRAGRARRPDPRDQSSKAVTVEVRAVRRLPAPVSLARIKDDPQLSDWELVRLPRLSVMPVNGAQWERIEELSRTQQGGPGGCRPG